MLQDQTPTHDPRAFLRRIWRRRMLRFTAAVLLLSIWIQAFAWLLLVPGLHYGLRYQRRLMRRLLYSVRAKLTAFYLYSALLPILLVAVVLLCVGYVVLGQVSARVVESRMERLTDWAQRRAQVAQASYWQSRQQGQPPAEAARVALEAAYGDVHEAGFSCWAIDAQQRVMHARGTVQERDLGIPGWLGTRPFIGIASTDTTQLALRSLLHFTEPGGRVTLASVLPLDSRLINLGIETRSDRDLVRGDLGEPRRAFPGAEARSESSLVQEGILAYLGTSHDVRVQVMPHEVRVRESRPNDPKPDAPQDGSPARPTWKLSRWSDVEPRHAPLVVRGETPLPDYQAMRRRIHSRYHVLDWGYIGYPVDWATGRTDESGPPIFIAASVEGAARALLRTGIGVVSPLWWVVLILTSVLVLAQIVATLRGFLYARAISDSVEKLDRGVRAVRSGDFGYRITPRERDQLGGLALAFNDMSQRLQEGLEERVAHQAVERELSIARDVQSRLFPERMPYAPFLEASGVCIPARTVSGDYYDFIDIGGGYDAIVADVSGKGISAALLMASVQASIRSLYPRGGRAAAPDPAEVLSRVNRYLHDYSEPTRFVTLFLVRYRGDGQLLYCNAGHNPAALVRAGEVEWLSSGGLVLGPFPDLVYEASRIAVQPGDVVCLYTDGVTEAESPSGEHFGEERLAEVLHEHAGEHPRQVQAAVQDRVHAWRGGTEAGDDVTVVVLRITA